MAADRQVEGEGGGAGIVQARQGDVGEVLPELVAGLDDVARMGGVGRVDGDLGAKAGVVGDVGVRRDPSMDVGGELRRDLAHGLQQLGATPPAECPPVDELTALGLRASAQSCGRHRLGGEGAVVQVHLVPVQAADRGVRARIEGLVEEGGVQRQGDQRIDAEGGQQAAERRQMGERRQRRLVLPQGVRRGEHGGTASQVRRGRHRRRGGDDRRRLVDTVPGDGEGVATEREWVGNVDVVSGDVEVDGRPVGHRQGRVFDPAADRDATPRADDHRWYPSPRFTDGAVGLEGLDHAAQ